MSVDKQHVQGLLSTMEDSMFIGHGVFATAIREELRIVIIEDMKVMPNKAGDANSAYCSLIRVARLGSPASSQENFDARMLKT